MNSILIGDSKGPVRTINPVFGQILRVQLQAQVFGGGGFDESLQPWQAKNAISGNAKPETSMRGSLYQ